MEKVSVCLSALFPVLELLNVCSLLQHRTQGKEFSVFLSFYQKTVLFSGSCYPSKYVAVGCRHLSEHCSKLRGGSVTVLFCFVCISVFAVVYRKRCCYAKVSFSGVYAFPFKNQVFSLPSMFGDKSRLSSLNRFGNFCWPHFFLRNYTLGPCITTSTSNCFYKATGSAAE